MIEAFHTLDNGTLVDFALDTNQRLTIRAGTSLTPSERPIVLVLTPADAVMLMRILRDLFNAQPIDLSNLPEEQTLTDAVVDAFLDAQPPPHPPALERIRRIYDLKRKAHLDTVLQSARDSHRHGATHDCGEWVLDGHCQVCDREV